MARTAAKPTDLDAIQARKQAILAELAELDEQAKVVELAARDAGRPILLAALDRVKIGAMEKSHARAIAAAIGTHGAGVIAQHLSTIQQP